MYLTNAVHNYLIQKQKQNDRDTTKFHPSSIGKCSRQIVYNMLGFPAPDLDGRVLMIFENGHSFHNRMEHFFDKAGILIAPELPISNKDLNISGRTDAVITVEDGIYKGNEIIVINGFEGKLYEGPASKIALVELKSINNKGFNRVCGKQAKEEHIWQLQIYLFLSGIKQGILFYENKDDQSTWETWVSYDQALVDRLIKKIVKINKCVDTKTLPLREYSRSSFDCKFCPYNQICWENNIKSLDELI